MCIAGALSRHVHRESAPAEGSSLLRSGLCIDVNLGMTRKRESSRIGKPAEEAKLAFAAATYRSFGIHPLVTILRFAVCLRRRVLVVPPIAPIVGIGSISSRVSSLHAMVLYPFFVVHLHVPT